MPKTAVAVDDVPGRERQDPPDLDDFDISVAAMVDDSCGHFSHHVVCSMALQRRLNPTVCQVRSSRALIGWRVSTHLSLNVIIEFRGIYGPLPRRTRNI